MINSVATSPLGCNYENYQNIKIIPRGAISEMIEDLKNSTSISDNEKLIDPKTGKPFEEKEIEVFSDENKRGFVHGDLMGLLTSTFEDGETRAYYCNMIPKIMERATVDDIDEYWKNYSSNKLNALKTLLEKTGLYDEKGKSFTQVVTEWYSRHIAELIEDDGKLERLNFLSDEEKQNCFDMSKKADSEKYIKYIQSLIMQHYEV